MAAGQQYQPLGLAGPLVGLESEVGRVRWSPAATTISSGVGLIRSTYTPARTPGTASPKACVSRSSSPSRTPA
jgi:hypothetical protein